MTVGQRVFELLKQKGMTQKEFSERTGIATTTISDWRKKNTNPGSDKILLICAALEVTPEYLLSGVSEDSDRGRNKEYIVIPQNTEERLLIEVFGKMVLLTADFVQNHPVLFVQNQPIFLSARDFFQIPGGHFSTILSGVLIHMQL